MRKQLVRFICLCFACLFLPAGPALADLELQFLDVGQGDCTVVLCDGESMIVDGGPESASDFLYTYLRNDLKLEHLDYLVSTHPHTDHVGGLAAVLNAVPVDLLLTPVTEWDSKRFRRMMEYAEMQGTVVDVPQAGDTLRLGGATVTVLHCWPEAQQYSTANDMSIVLRIDYGDTAFLLMGDAESTSEYMMIDAGMPLKADVLRVAHHGSYSATTAEFLREVSPSWAVISCGKGNGYSHPHQVLLDRLKGITLFRTDLQGTVRCFSDGKEIRFEVEKETREDLYAAPGG